MIIALDIDGTIEEQPVFFCLLTHAFSAAGHEIVVLSGRAPKSGSTEQALEGYKIKYDRVVYASSMEQKANLCKEMGVDILFDDEDEIITAVDEKTTVYKVRNDANFDFSDRKWLSTERLTRLL